MPIIISGSGGTTTISGSGATVSGSDGATTYGSGSVSGSTTFQDVTTFSGSIYQSGSGNTVYFLDNVGIGTTAPLHTLSVTGTMGVSDTTTLSGQLTASSGMHIPAYQFITFGTGSANRMDVGMQGITLSGSGVRIESSGSIELELKKYDSQINLVSGSASLQFSFDDTSDTTFIRPDGTSTSEVIFQNHDGFEVARVHDHSGGIGGFGYRRNLEQVTSALDLSNVNNNIEYSDNVLLVTMPRTGGAYIITLPTTQGALTAPAIMNGFHLRIIVTGYADGANGGTDSDSVTITVGDIAGTPGVNADIIMGHIMAADMGAAPTGITKTNQVITLDGTNGAPVVLPGDYIDLTCVYSNTAYTAWHVVGMATT